MSVMSRRCEPQGHRGCRFRVEVTGSLMRATTVADRCGGAGGESFTRRVRTVEPRPLPRPVELTGHPGAPETQNEQRCASREGGQRHARGRVGAAEHGRVIVHAGRGADGERHAARAGGGRHQTDREEDHGDDEQGSSEAHCSQPVRRRVSHPMASRRPSAPTCSRADGEQPGCAGGHHLGPQPQGGGHPACRAGQPGEESGPQPARWRAWRVPMRRACSACPPACPGLAPLTLRDYPEWVTLGVATPNVTIPPMPWLSAFVGPTNHNLPSTGEPSHEPERGPPGSAGASRPAATGLATGLRESRAIASRMAMRPLFDILKGRGRRPQIRPLEESSERGSLRNRPKRQHPDVLKAQYEGVKPRVT